MAQNPVYINQPSILSTLFGGGYANAAFETKGNDTEIQQAISSKTMNGIEGIPYQFDETVDRRLAGGQLGRKYADKIYSRMPLLFLTPCKSVFMGDSPQADKNVIASMLLDQSLSDAGSLIKEPGRYYTLEYDFANYWNYVNTMLTAVSVYMGIGDLVLPGFGGKLLRKINWAEESNEGFRKALTMSSHQVVVYYLDGMETMSRSFSTSTTDSSLASQINGFADQANEIKFLFGTGGALSNLLEGTEDLTASIGSSLAPALSALGGGIVGSLAGKGVNTILNGGKLVFPQIWQDSSADESYSLDIKLRSPDHDNLSIFLNIMKPYCKLLALTLPHQAEDNIFAYNSPFLCKAFCKGMFNVDYGMITGLNVTSGAQCQWNDDGLPTQIDISIDLSNLYKSLSMGGNDPNHPEDVVRNTAYIDFLANISGLNVYDMEVGRKTQLYWYLQSGGVSRIPSRLYNRLDQAITRLTGDLYNRI